MVCTNLLLLRVTTYLMLCIISHGLVFVLSAFVLHLLPFLFELEQLVLQLLLGIFALLLPLAHHVLLSRRQAKNVTLKQK